MQVLKLEVEDSKLDVILTIINNLQDNIIRKYEIVNTDKEQKEFTKLFIPSLDKVWDNKEDSIYDKFL